MKGESNYFDKNVERYFDLQMHLKPGDEGPRKLILSWHGWEQAKTLVAHMAKRPRILHHHKLKKP